jgi:hypothetical protein
LPAGVAAHHPFARLPPKLREALAECARNALKGGPFGSHFSLRAYVAVLNEVRSDFNQFDIARFAPF